MRKHLLLLLASLAFALPVCAQQLEIDVSTPGQKNILTAASEQVVSGGIDFNNVPFGYGIQVAFWKRFGNTWTGVTLTFLQNVNGPNSIVPGQPVACQFPSNVSGQAPILSNTGTLQTIPPGTGFTIVCAQAGAVNYRLTFGSLPAPSNGLLDVTVNTFPLSTYGNANGVQVQGTTAPGVTNSQNPIIIGGVDGGGNVQSLRMFTALGVPTILRPLITSVVGQATANGESESLDVTQAANLYSNITSNTSTVVKSGAGIFHSITVNNPGTAESLTIFDNTSCSGTKIGTSNALVASQTTLTYDVKFSTGLCITSAGTTAGDWTISYR